MTILVVNPNSNPDVTAAIEQTAAAFRLDETTKIEVQDLAEAPFGIESQRDGDLVAPMLTDIAAERRDLTGLVIACFSDPGLAACREVAPCPVWGIGEAAVATALARADTAGVVALSTGSVARHWRAWRRLGVATRIVGEEPVSLSVAQSGDRDVLPALAEAGQRLIRRGADIIIMGCAGMGGQAHDLEQRLGVPVIDPVAAGIGMALAHVLSGRHALAAGL
ncbi:MAG: aspartate/glutamate racemase family protein [Pseudomonadota bacterium]